MSLPLDDVRILDLTHHAAGPFGVMILADLGAEVVKIEPPGKGDGTRALGPWVGGPPGPNTAGGFLRMNRNKQSVTLDIRDERGKAVFRDLVKKCDVVWENFSAGTMERLGLGPAALKEVNPQIIYASTSGFGHTDFLPSPYASRGAFDMVIQAMSGIAEMTGAADGPPTRVGVIIGDLVPALATALGVMVALHQRGRDGRGQHVDIAMYDVMAAMCERAIGYYLLSGGTVPTRGADATIAPYNLYLTTDGHVAIAAHHGHFWQRLARLIGREDLAADPGLQTPGDRAAKAATIVDPAITAWTSGLTKAEVVERLNAERIPCGPVQTPAEVARDPHIAARHMVLDLEHPVAGPYQIVGNPIKLSNVPQPALRPAPLLGQHTESILRDLLGYDEAKIAELRAAHVI